MDIETGLRGGMAPPITYMLDGKQYVALFGGARVLPPLPNTPPPAPRGVPGNAPAGPIVPPKLLTFDGKGTLPK